MDFLRSSPWWKNRWKRAMLNPSLKPGSRCIRDLNVWIKPHTKAHALKIKQNGWLQSRGVKSLLGMIKTWEAKTKRIENWKIKNNKQVITRAHSWLCVAPVRCRGSASCYYHWVLADSSGQYAGAPSDELGGSPCILLSFLLSSQGLQDWASIVTSFSPHFSHFALISGSTFWETYPKHYGQNKVVFS